MKVMKRWKPMIAMDAACFAGGLWETTGQETTEQERLEIQYTNTDGNSETREVSTSTEQLTFYDAILNLPTGLTKLHTLVIRLRDAEDSFIGKLMRILKLPKDIKEDADRGFQLVLDYPITTQVHKDMGTFTLACRTRDRGGDLNDLLCAGQNPTCERVDKESRTER